MESVVEEMRYGDREDECVRAGASVDVSVSDAASMIRQKMIAKWTAASQTWTKPDALRVVARWRLLWLVQRRRVLEQDDWQWQRRRGRFASGGEREDTRWGESFVGEGVVGVPCAFGSVGGRSFPRCVDVNRGSIRVPV